MRSTRSMLFGAVILALPAAAVAQQEGEAQAEAEVAVESCTVTLQPTDLPAGEEAIHVMGTLSGDFGAVTGFEAPAESGITLAETDDIPLDEMANDEVEVVDEVEVEAEVEEGEVEVEAEAEMETEELEYSAIEAGTEPNTFTVWLSTEAAAAGAFDVSFTTAEAACDATVTVVTEGETEGK
jgi:hypothetical protein